MERTIIWSKRTNLDVWKDPRGNLGTFTSAIGPYHSIVHTYLSWCAYLDVVHILLLFTCHCDASSLVLISLGVGLLWPPVSKTKFKNGHILVEWRGFWCLHNMLGYSSPPSRHWLILSAPMRPQVQPLSQYIYIYGSAIASNSDDTLPSCRDRCPESFWA